MFESGGITKVPKTWEELREVDKKLTIYKTDNYPTLTQPGAIATLKFWQFRYNNRREAQERFRSDSG